MIVSNINNANSKHVGRNGRRKTKRRGRVKIEAVYIRAWWMKQRICPGII